MCEKWEYSTNVFGCDDLTLPIYQAPTQLLTPSPLLQDGEKIEDKQDLWIEIKTVKQKLHAGKAK